MLITAIYYFNIKVLVSNIVESRGYIYSMSNSYLKDIEEILLAIQINQSKYKYDFILETVFNQKEKKLRKQYTIIKYHKEKLYDEYLGKNRLVKVEDDKVRGGIVSMLQYMADEFNELQGTDDS